MPAQTSTSLELGLALSGGGPRKDVVEKVPLGAARASCVTAAPLKALFQTEEGVKGCSSTGCTGFLGAVGGDIKLITDGKTGYTITVSKRRRDDTTFTMPQETRWDFDLDESNAVVEAGPGGRKPGSRNPRGVEVSVR